MLPPHGFEKNGFRKDGFGKVGCPKGRLSQETAFEKTAFQKDGFHTHLFLFFLTRAAKSRAVLRELAASPPLSSLYFFRSAVPTITSCLSSLHSRAVSQTKFQAFFSSQSWPLSWRKSMTYWGSPICVLLAVSLSYVSFVCVFCFAVCKFI
jgi:hypothetical protein